MSPTKFDPRIVWLLLLALAEPLQAQSTLQPWLDQQRLSVRSWVEPGDDIVVQQRVTLYIELATDTWFTAGTRIGRLELDDAVVLRRDQFAVNSTQQSMGKTFTVQRWSMEIYPQRAGRFAIPALPLEVSIADDDAQALEGELWSPPVQFSAALPTGLGEQQSWIAAKKFRIEERFDRDLDNLVPGDAVQREVIFYAEDTAAMMLPQWQAVSQDGIGVYPKPPQLFDDNNRGQQLARRVESTSYLIERGGRYQLPSHTYYWWDLDSNSLQSASLPEHVLEAATDAVQAATPADAQDESAGWRWLALPLLLLLASAGVLVYRLRRRPLETDNIQPVIAAPLGEKALRERIERALAQQDWPQLVQALYRWLDAQHDPRYNYSVRALLQRADQQQYTPTLDTLMQAAWYQGQADSADMETLAQILLQCASEDGKKRTWRSRSISLDLN